MSLQRIVSRETKLTRHNYTGRWTGFFTRETTTVRLACGCEKVFRGMTGAPKKRTACPVGHEFGSTLTGRARERELEQLGYACLPLPLSASDVGAPHRRARIFVVAHLNGGRELQPQGSEREQWGRAKNSSSSDADRDVLRLESGRRGGARGYKAREPRNAAPNVDQSRREGSGPNSHEGWLGFTEEHGWAPKSGLVPLVHGLSGGLAGRRRRARIRALGNSVVPQQAEVVGYVIRELVAALASAEAA